MVLHEMILLFLDTHWYAAVVVTRVLLNNNIQESSGFTFQLFSLSSLKAVAVIQYLDSLFIHS